MEWKDISNNPLLIEHYNLIQKTGLFDYIDEIKKKDTELEKLMLQAYDIFTKESVDEIISYLISCLSDKFIPSKLTIILNEGVINNKVNSITFEHLKKVESDVGILSLEPYESFFSKNSGTISFHKMEYDITNKELIEPFKMLNADIIVPIIGLSGLYGVIIFGPKILDKDYTSMEISYIDKLMKFISIGIQNNVHYQHSVKDSKTGLYNHSFFISRVKEEISRSERSGNTFSLAILDIDKFKVFNDTYGHLAGDEVIIEIAHQLKKEFRESDIISRFGGEEFTALFPETGSSMSYILAERIRSSIEALDIIYKGIHLKVTVSVGVCVFRNDEEIDANEILKRADEALYESKENGRNRVTIFKTGLLHKANKILKL